MELDVRRLYLGEGFSSLFTFCTQALHLSEPAAYNRIEAARAARRFPVILDLLHEGTVTLTTVRLLAPHLTPDNHRSVLDRARYKTKREIEVLAASLNPRPDVPTAVRRLPPPASQPAFALPRSTGRGLADIFQPSAASWPAPSKQTCVTEVKPLAPERYKIQFTIGRDTYEKLRRAQDLLRHTVPTGDPAVIFERALTLLVADLERSKIAATDRPRAARGASTGSRHIPAAITRAVWNRDGGRCAFKGAQGRFIYVADRVM